MQLLFEKDVAFMGVFTDRSAFINLQLHKNGSINLHIFLWQTIDDVTSRENY
jgi:hypothetical protein